jgi:hypothetical protein
VSKARRAIAASAVALLLVSCVLEEPVFEAGLTRPAAAREGIWDTVNADGAAQHAALFPLGENTSLLQYPVATNGWWFEAQSLQINGRDLLQLRILAGPEAKPAESGSKNHTLAWLEPQPDGSVQMRALDGSAIEKAKFTATSLRAFLTDPVQDWNTVFGSPTTFRRIVAEK